MKKVLFCLGLFVVAAATNLMAQSAIDADDEHNFNHFYNQTLTSERRAMPYPFLRENDVVWKHCVWRTIDFREYFNQFFYYPTDQSKNTQDRINLTNCIMNALQNGDIEVFEDDDLKVPKDYEALAAQLNRSYTYHIPEYDEYGDELEGRDTILTEEFKPEDVFTARLKEYWYIDKQDTRQKVRITGLTLVYNYCRERDGERSCEPVEMFWVPMDDMRVRNVLVKANAYDKANAASLRTYDEVFVTRYFDSFIYRETNTWNRTIASYLTGTDAILESQRIEDMVFDIESDMWEY